MLLAIPEYRGKSRDYDAGAFGFPYLAIADIIVNAAYGGWSYWKTKQQIEQAQRISGAPPASAMTVDAITNEVLKKLGSDTPKRDVEKFVSTILKGAPTETMQPPPSVLLEARLATLERRQQQQRENGGGIPIWGWIIMGVLGFMVVSKSGMLGGG